METLTEARIHTLLIALVTLATLMMILYKNAGSTTTKKVKLIKRDVSEDMNCGGKKRLLVISFDGFRWNYLNRTETPNFDRFLLSGVQARNGIRNAFLTISNPNHFSIATGLWEESHNIVSNTMYDPVLNQTFRDSNKSACADSDWFDTGAEPIWVTNQLRGKSHSGIIMWIGGDAMIRGSVPEKNIGYDINFKNETKVEKIIEWFQNDCLMNLGMIYFPQPDIYGHEFGPESEQVTQMIGGLDKLVGYLLERLEEEHLLNNTNIILTSDHGLSNRPTEGEIFVDDIIDSHTYHLSSDTPVAGIWPHSGFLREIYENLTAAAKERGHFTVYMKKDIPDRYHYKHSVRIPPIIAVADELYSFTFSGDKNEDRGDHGYDNRLGDMHPFFLAMGPDFKSGYSVETFDIVDVYPLMCHLLGVQQAPNNGSLDIVKNLLKPSSYPDDENSLFAVLMPLLFALIFVFLFIALGVRKYVADLRKKTRNDNTTSVASQAVTDATGAEETDFVGVECQDGDSEILVQQRNANAATSC